MHHAAKAPGCGHGGAARESGDGRRTGPRGGLPHSWLGPGFIGTGTSTWKGGRCGKGKYG